MKQILTISFLFLVSANIFADSADQLVIKHNGKEFYNRFAYAKRYSDTLVLRSLSAFDTITFDLTTDWGGEYDMSLEVFDANHKRLDSLFRKAGVLSYVVQPENLSSELNFKISYGQKYDIKPWEVVISKNYKRPWTQLSIVQGNDTILVHNKISRVRLKTEPFKLIFETINSDAVFLNCSYDSTSYMQFVYNQRDSLTCFYSPQTFSEPSKNSDLDIIAVKFVNRGYHCLYAYAEDDEFVRFDQVMLTNKSDWIGIRTIKSVLVLPGNTNIPMTEMKGSVLYFVYSPGLEKDGNALRISFE